MAEFPPFPIHPDEVVFEVMIKDPYFIDIKSGEMTPMIDFMGWNRIAVKYHQECEHIHTVCDECADTWMEDHFIRITVPDEGVLYTSPDAPQEPKE